MINKEVKYGLKDIEIVQSPVSHINSRLECDPFDNNMLPLFTAPMSSVVDLNNYKLFKDNKINPIIPRHIDLQTRKEICTETWCAFSLKEFDEIIKFDEFSNNKKHFALIDIANGNMCTLHESIRVGKLSYGDNLIIMAGNIANPEAYAALSNAGADYIRCGIGGGAGCITSSNTGIHYPIASLISECYDISLILKNPARIIADGGIKGYADITKCLALGADFVMCGSIFNKMLESAGETTYTDNIMVVNQYSNVILDEFKEGYCFDKVFYGMSTKKAQKELGNAKLKTSEGIERVFEVEYTMSQWVDNFTNYLRSAMSYTNSKDLDYFIGNVQTIVISEAAQNAINK